MHKHTMDLLARLEAVGGRAEIQAVDLLIAERIRQVEEEGWGTQSDDTTRRDGQLAAAGACYALASSQRAKVHASTGSVEVRPSAVLPAWPFSPLAWKPTSMRRMTVKASALLLAELARLLRSGLE